MTNEIQGVGSGSMMPQDRQARMTESQKTLFREIISKYDAKNFTIADFEAMGKEFRQAGIRPSNEVKSMLEVNGFNVEQYRKDRPGGIGGPKGMHGPRPMTGPGGMGKPKDMQEGLQQLLTISEETDDIELKSLVEEILAKNGKGSVTEEDELRLTSYLQKNVPLIGFFMDTSV